MRPLNSLGSSIWKPEFSSAVSYSSHALSLAVWLCSGYKQRLPITYTRRTYAAAHTAQLDTCDDNQAGNLNISFPAAHNCYTKTSANTPAP